VKNTIGILLILLCARSFGALSPYSLQPGFDYSFAGAGLALRGYAEWVDHVRYRDTTEFRTLDRRDIPAFDRWAIGYYSPRLDEASTVLTALEFAVPVAVNLWDMKTGQEARYGIVTDLVIYSEVYCYSSSLAIYAKALTIHARPLAFTPAAPQSERAAGDARSSFFSAHTTSAFASAVFTSYTFQLKHPDSPLVPWVWGGMLTAASTVGALRIFSGKHFPSDVLAGAIVGSALGYGIPRYHLNKVAKEINKEESRTGAAHWRLEPALVRASSGDLPMPGLALRF
jgi:membrane-associated phospholipid phosphatase